MSRSNMAKSRVDKAGKAVSAPTPAQVHDIVPGKFNDQDWNNVLDRDEGDDFVTDIIEEICGSALDIIYQSYIDKQLIPYTVSQAKDAIVQIIEWQFLNRDEGEGDVSADVGWIEDEEPAPAVTDCWAQGSVPKQIVTPREVTIIEEEEPVTSENKEMSQIAEEEETGEEADQVGAPMGGITHERTIIEEESTLIVEGSSIPQAELSQDQTEITQESTTTKKKQKFRPHYGKLKSAGLKQMTESLEQTEMQMYINEYMQHMPPEMTPEPELLNMPNSCHSILKLQAGRPPGKRDVFYDEYGNVTAVNKINPEKLPNHRIKTRYNIVDPEVEAAQERLEAMRTGRYIKKDVPKIDPKPPGTSKTSSFTRTHGGRNSMTSNTVRTGFSTRTGKSSKSEKTKSIGPRSPLPPPMIEYMEVVPGVIVREGDRVKKGPRQRPRQEDLIAMAIQRGLRSVKLNQAEASISLSEILENRTPTLKPLVDQSPIPPIASYQRV